MRPVQITAPVGKAVGAADNNDGFAAVTEHQAGTHGTLVYDGISAPSTKAFTASDLTPDDTYAFKVVAWNSVGQGVVSPGGAGQSGEESTRGASQLRNAGVGSIDRIQSTSEGELWRRVV